MTTKEEKTVQVSAQCQAPARILFARRSFRSGRWIAGNEHFNWQPATNNLQLATCNS
jgi:hypothetical protein